MNTVVKRRITGTLIAVALFCSNAAAGLPAVAEEMNAGKAECKEMHHAAKTHYCPKHHDGRDGKEARWHHRGQFKRALGKLDLTDAQKKSVHQIRMSTAKSVIKKKADVKIAKMELHEMLRSDKVDMGAVEKQLNKISGLKTAMMLDRINAHEDIKALLTPEQKKTLSEIIRSSHENRGDVPREG